MLVQLEHFHTYTFSTYFIYISSYLTSCWQATCNYSYSPASGGFMVLWLCHCGIQSGSKVFVYWSQWDAGCDWCYHFAGLRYLEGWWKHACCFIQRNEILSIDLKQRPQGQIFSLFFVWIQPSKMKKKSNKINQTPSPVLLPVLYFIIVSMLFHIEKVSRMALCIIYYCCSPGEVPGAAQ